jgi:hypothetical protein
VDQSSFQDEATKVNAANRIISALGHQASRHVVRSPNEEFTFSVSGNFFEL